MKMKTKMLMGFSIVLLMLGSTAVAGDADALIELDKTWGAAASQAEAEEFLADYIIALDIEGATDKPGMMAAAAAVAAAAAADALAEEEYVAGDYQVNFLSDDIAVMVHSASGSNPHWSMHVWQKIDGNWQVAATATIPIGD
jgi:hypothetical protein